jgi:hypothetical protein
MNPKIQKLTLKITDLQSQTEKQSETLKSVRIKANDILWNLREIKEKDIASFK